jgi:hypothetical protein
LSPAKLLAQDGNNSVKRAATAGTADPRVFNSDYFLSREQVDLYKDEVKSRDAKATVKRRRPENDPVDDQDASEDDAPWAGADAQGDPTDTQGASPCATQWKASAAEHQKRSLDIYESTGMFVSACRHGLILKACEMVRSGEL